MPQLSDPRFVLAVHDLAASSKFYVNALGFTESHNDGMWSFLSRDAFAVMLGECPDVIPARELGDHSYVAYLRVNDVDALHAEFAGKGVEMLSSPADEPWGMREFGIRTLDGHRFKFGSPLIS